jgi:hypothetical protein
MGEAMNVLEKSKSLWKINKKLAHHLKLTKSFIGLYKFCVKFNFHKFIQQSYEFHVMVNMKDICT